MAGAPLLTIIDDTSTTISYGPVGWNISTLASWFNGTGHVSTFASKSQLGTIFLEFQGVSVAFFGITPLANSSQTLAVSIDGSEPTNTSYNDPNPPSYRQWYQSPVLPEGSHKINLTNLTGTSLDFAVVTVGNNTPLAGQVVIVDNEDPSITFEGNWQLSDQSSNSTQFPNGLPFHNSTRDSSTIGDNLIFRFTGQSAAIYGTFTWSNVGLLTLTFTMDGSPLSQTYQVTTTTSQFQSQLGQQQNFLFYSFDFLQSGNHTLVVNVTDCVNQTFSFDYITFTPTFSTLATQPNLTSLTGPTSDHSSSHKSFSAGAIAGIVIVVIVVLGCAYFARRLRNKNSRNSLIYPFRPARHDVGTFPAFQLDNRSSNATSNVPNVSRYTPIYPVEDPPRNEPINEENPVENDDVPPPYDHDGNTIVVR